MLINNIVYIIYRKLIWMYILKKIKFYIFKYVNNVDGLLVK